MKKNSAKQKNTDSQANKPQTMAVDNLKYEVGQEMGIKPKKNQAGQGNGVKPRCP
jgi:hypothetical protein